MNKSTTNLFLSKTCDSADSCELVEEELLCETVAGASTALLAADDGGGAAPDDG